MMPVTIVRGPQGNIGNAIEKVCDNFLANLSAEHTVQVAPENVYRGFVKNYGEGPWHIMFPMYTPILRRHKNTLVTAYDIVPLRWARMRDKHITGNRLVKMQYRFVYNGIKRKKLPIATITEFQKREMVQWLGLPEDRVTVIPLGIDHGLYNTKVSKENAKTMLGLQQDVRYISCVSNVSPLKNLSLLHMITPFLDDDTCILKVGGRFEGNKIFNLVGVPEPLMPCVYRASDVFVHPSKYCIGDMVVVEACACGVPIVAFDNGAQPEITKQKLVHYDGTPQCDIDFVEATLRAIEKKPRPRTKDVTKFTWGNFAKGYEKLYSQLWGRT